MAFHGTETRRSAKSLLSFGAVIVAVCALCYAGSIQANLTFGGLPAIDRAAEELAAELAAAAALEQKLAEAAEQRVLENAEEAVADDLIEEVQEAVSAELEASVAASSELTDDSAGVFEGISRHDLDGSSFETEADSIIDNYDATLDGSESYIHRGQWLVMAEAEVFDQLASEGYLFDKVTELTGLGLRLAEVEAPASFSLSAMREGIYEVVGADRAQVDLNHIYTAGVPERVNMDGYSLQPMDALEFPLAVRDLPLKIGMIDSAVDINHEAFRSANVNSRSFVANQNDPPAFHGTAVASIIVGSASGLQGLAPKTQLRAASVFENDDELGEITSTVNLVKALDWMVAAEVDVVNLSLAGPPNKLLEIAISRLANKNISVVAAAGNGGPVAGPQYPAAYPGVVAVTAVDANKRAFRLANRGEYLDVAAPGVNLRHALAGGGYTASSGTSFAVPFAATAVALLKFSDPGVDVGARLAESAVDLGSPGKDSIYGYGLLRIR